MSSTMSNVIRERKTGAFYRRAAKFRKRDEDAHQAGPSRNVPVEAVPDLPPSVECPPEPSMEPEAPLPVAPAESELLLDFLDDCDAFSDAGDAEDGTFRNIEVMSIVEGLKYWALSNNETHRSIGMVLKLFKEAGVKVPANAKTLLQTNRNASREIVEIAGGEYWYNGFKKTLSSYFWLNEPPAVEQITLTLSVNGLPLHRSGTCQFWPVLFAIEECRAAPVMTAAIYCGLNKPNSVEQYLGPVVRELTDLIRDGIRLQGKPFAVKVRAIVANPPAREFIKGVVSQTEYNSCHKCTVVGEYSHAGRTVVFPYEHAPSRTNHGFRVYDPPGHRSTATPLTELPGFDMVKDLPCCDCLHLLDLGMSRFFMIHWRDGKLGQPKWTASKIGRISSALKHTAQPCEVRCKVRHIYFLSYWKGPEYAFFFYYSSFIVLKEHIRPEEYAHFMLLFCAMTLLSSNAHKAKWPLAGQMLDKFVQDFETVYGRRYMTSAVHNLMHVQEEVERFGPLSTFSTYRFEGELLHLKRLVRSGWQNLQQAMNRLSDLQSMSRTREQQTAYPVLTSTGQTLKVQVRERFTLQKTATNCWFLTTDGTIVKFESAEKVMVADKEQLIVRGHKMDRKMSAFDGPMDSSEMFIFKGCNRDISASEIVTCPTEKILCKLVVTKRSEELTFVPLLHTFLDG